MPPTGSNFTDWQQVERETRLLIDEDFSWSEPPRRSRRRVTDGAASVRRMTDESGIRAARPVAVLDHEADHRGYEDSYDEPARAYASAPVAASPVASAPVVEERWDRPTETHSHFDEMMAEWNANYGFDDRASADRAFDLSDPGVTAPASGTRRTVLITGHGDERYLPAPRQRRASELRFHERSSFSPDRLALWAVLLSLALVIGAIAH